VAAQAVQRRRQEIDRQVASRIDEADAQAGRAHAALLDARARRETAFEAFDRPDRDAGESLWRAAALLPGRIDADFERAEQALDAALVLDPARETARARLGAVLAEHLAAARELRLVQRAGELEARLVKLDPDGSRGMRRQAPALLRLVGTPAGAQLTLERYEQDATTGARAAHMQPFPAAGDDKLAPGSYRVSSRAPGRAELRVPFEAVPGETATIDLNAPPATAVPEGFVYVPAGTFWFGDGDERLRVEFLDTVPAHRRTSGAYVIGRHEVTYAEWIAFLETLPAREQTEHAPNVSSITRGGLQLLRQGRSWQLSFQPTSQRYTAASGTPVSYVGRTLRAKQDWLQFPVTGISSVQAARYAAWMDATGRVPGARLCTEVEWERAARGADERPFPHGDVLSPDDANFDTTYGRVDTAYGPDAVGAHPASRSPFEIDDLAGNVLELTVSSLKGGEIVMRGGAYFFNSATCRTTNRNVVPPTFRDVTSGIRICASLGDPHGGKDPAR
jgi:formylglycine-generating enzyme required for sulfatase activity